DIRRVEEGLDIAYRAMKNVNPPFEMATSGWVLGPPRNRGRFDEILPKDVAVSCITRDVGFSTVTTTFSSIQNRGKWAIPWLEDDNVMITPQSWVGRLRKDAADAYAYGCSGLLGLHWRTRILGPNISALMKAGWDQSGWNGNLDITVANTEPIRKDVQRDGLPYAYPNHTILNTSEQEIYKTMCYGMAGYYVEVPNGFYTVTLQFCEAKIYRNGGRVFDVKIEGKQVLDDFDIFQTAGKDRALDYSYSGIEVDDGELQIDFFNVLHFATIAGIVVRGKTAEGEDFERKINCGGSAYADYECDLPASGAVVRECPRREMETSDFYLDWASSLFGAENGEEIAGIFAGIDGGGFVGGIGLQGAILPRHPQFHAGPGGLRPINEPWEEVKKRFEFVEKLQTIRPRINDKGNLARFDYWLNSYNYMREISRLCCLRGELDALLDQASDAADSIAFTRNTILPKRLELARAWEKMMTFQLSRVTNTAEMGEIANLELHSRTNLKFLILRDSTIAGLLGEGLPPEIHATTDYLGKPRIIVPTRRTHLEQGENLELKVIILANEPATGHIFRRDLGDKTYQKRPLIHLGRGVYTVSLTDVHNDFEYYLEAETQAGEKLLFPPTAQDMNQTVIVTN
ncbi:MAG: malectin domain-containing carbohydrate-binding protein, partial [Bacteroidota bacterium]